MTPLFLAFSVPGVAQSYELVLRGCVQLSYDPGVILGELMSPTKVVAPQTIMSSVAGLRAVTNVMDSAHRTADAFTGLVGAVGTAGAAASAALGYLRGRNGPRLGANLRQGGGFTGGYEL